MNVPIDKATHHINLTLLNCKEDNINKICIKIHVPSNSSNFGNKRSYVDTMYCRFT